MVDYYSTSEEEEQEEQEEEGNHEDPCDVKVDLKGDPTSAHGESFLN